jgi:N-acetylglucosaminyldiphosphoundecaprenol N-acetyl-beta-D-mannosaminyltransferase
MFEGEQTFSLNHYLCPKIDGQLVNVINISQALQLIALRIIENRGFTFFTLNLDHLVKRRHHQPFSLAYHACDFVCADGFPIVWLSRLKGIQIQKATGADLLRPICHLAAELNKSVFFFGSTEQSLQKATDQLQLEFPTLHIVGHLSPPMDFASYSDESDIFGDQIANSGAALCFVLLGAPKQELFAYRQSKRYPNIGFLCFGAAADFVSKEQQRAPFLLQKLNLEWAWRLMINPRRLAGRYLSCALLFVKLLFQKS